MVLEDDVDAVAINIFLTNLLRVNGMKQLAIRRTWKRSLRVVIHRLRRSRSQSEGINIKANIGANSIIADAVIKANINAIFKTKKEQAIL